MESQEIKAESDSSEPNHKPLTVHKKKQLLEFLQSNDCTRANLETSKFVKRNYDRVVDFIYKNCEEAQSRVNEECDSVSLSNINQWLELLKTTQLSERCEYEATAVLNSIVNNEPQPKPEELGGIDLREAYSFLENALAGQPPKRLSEQTKKFLFQEIELLIEEANTDDSDELARQMGQSLSTFQDYDYKAQPHKSSIDPFFLDK